MSRLAVILAVLAGCSFKSGQLPDALLQEQPRVAFEFSSSGSDEGATGQSKSTIAIPVVLSEPATETVRVKCSAIAGGSAEPGVDFLVIDAELTFSAGESRKEVVVDVFKDTNEAEGESFSLGLTDAVGAELDAERIVHTVTISDSILPRVSFTTLSTTTAEGTPTSLMLSLDLPSDGDSTVTIGVSPTGATPMDVEDITLAEGTIITIPSGATSHAIPIGEIQDTLDEPGTEDVAFELKGASANLVIDSTKSDATHAITDDDDPPTVDFLVAAANADEDDATVTVTVRLSNESTLPVSVDYARSNAGSAVASDATVNGTSVSFTPRTAGVPGETQKTFTISITNDLIDENAETVMVDLSSPTNATLGTNVTHTLTINVDATDPPPNVSFVASTSSNNEGDTGSDVTNISVALSTASGKTITVPFSITGTAEDSGTTSAGGNDFDVETASPLSFAPGVTTVTIAVRVFGDIADETPADETVILTLANNPTNATVGAIAVHTLTIDDTD